MAHLLLDIGTVAIIVGIVLSAAGKGFVRSVIELIGTVVSFTAASVFSASAGDWISEKLIDPLLMNAVSGSSRSFTVQSLQTVSQVFAQYHLNTSGLQSLAAGGGQAADSLLMDALVKPVGAVLGRGAAFFILFMLFMMIVRIVAHISEILNKLPIIRGINHLGGAAVGAVEAVFVMFVICLLVSALIPMLSMQKNPVLTGQTINQTVLFRYFYQVNPVKDILLKT